MKDILANEYCRNPSPISATAEISEVDENRHRCTDTSSFLPNGAVYLKNELVNHLVG